MTRHEYGTLFPTDLSGVANRVEEIAEAGGAIYDVHIELMNGQWDVRIMFQDDELDSHEHLYRMDTHGGIETNARVLA